MLACAFFISFLSNFEVVKGVKGKGGGGRGEEGMFSEVSKSIMKNTL